MPKPLPSRWGVFTWLRSVPAALVLFAFELLPAISAHAQGRDPAAAQALFDQARSLMEAGRYEEACSKLAESQRLDSGVGTQFNLAVCYEQQGKIASAWATFLEVASIASASGQQARASAATRRASMLESRLPRLKLTVPQEAQVAGLEIKRDGAIVGGAQWEMALPVDPGEHLIELTAPGRKALTRSVSASAGVVTTFTVPVLAAEEAPSATPAVAEVPAVQPVARTPPQAPAVNVQPARVRPATQDRVEPSSGPGGGVIALGIVGVVAIGGGSVLGVIAMNKDDESKKHCAADDPNSCSAEGVDLRDDAFLFGNIATAAFIAGGAALAAGSVLWLTSDPEEEQGTALTLRAGPSAARVIVQGVF